MQSEMRGIVNEVFAQTSRVRRPTAGTMAKARAGRRSLGGVVRRYLRTLADVVHHFIVDPARAGCVGWISSLTPKAGRARGMPLS